MTTLSCPTSGGHALLAPLLASTAGEIEHALPAQSTSRDQRLLFAFTVASRAGRGPAIEVIGPEFTIAGPEVNRRLSGLDHTLLWEYVRAVAAGSRSDGSDFGLPPEIDGVGHDGSPCSIEFTEASAVLRA